MVTIALMGAAFVFGLLFDSKPLANVMDSKTPFDESVVKIVEERFAPNNTKIYFIDLPSGQRYEVTTRDNEQIINIEEC